MPFVAMQGIHCNLHTGQERQVLAGARHVSCTIEMINTAKQWDCAVIDEIQVR
jgi:ATP-dependent RNA helicase SUPV3L1/SUV3